MNTNLIHNIINVVIALIASAAAFDWSVFLSATAAAKIVAGLAIAKIVINAIRDGLGGLVKEQPPVQ